MHTDKCHYTLESDEDQTENNIVHLSVCAEANIYAQILSSSLTELQ